MASSQVYVAKVTKIVLVVAVRRRRGWQRQVNCYQIEPGEVVRLCMEESTGIYLITIHIIETRGLMASLSIGQNRMWCLEKNVIRYVAWRQSYLDLGGREDRKHDLEHIIGVKRLSILSELP